MTNEQLELLREWVKREIDQAIYYSEHLNPSDKFNKLKESFKPDYTRLSKEVCVDDKDNKG